MANTAFTVGSKLVELCRQHKFLDAINSLYDPNIVSDEAVEMPGHPRTLKGIEAVRGKSQWWVDNHTIHRVDVEGPFPHGEDMFAVIMALDVTPKTGPMAGQRMSMKEVCVYTLIHGKIVHEAFFYHMG